MTVTVTAVCLFAFAPEIQYVFLNMQKKIKLKRFITLHLAQFMVIREFIQQLKEFKLTSQFQFMV